MHPTLRPLTDRLTRLSTASIRLGPHRRLPIAGATALAGLAVLVAVMAAGWTGGTGDDAAAPVATGQTAPAAGMASLPDVAPAAGARPDPSPAAVGDGGAAAAWDGWIRFTNPAAGRFPAAVEPAIGLAGALPGTVGLLAATGTAAPGGADTPRGVRDDLSDADHAAAAVMGLADSLLERPYREGTEERVVRVEPGDTLMALLRRAGVGRDDAHDAIAAMEEIYDPRRLQIGQEVTLAFEHHGRNSDFLGLTLMPDVETWASVARSDDGGYQAVAEENALVTRRTAAAGVIDSSLAGDAAEAGVPYQVLSGLVRAYSYDVDFQRELQPGDRFTLLFEQDFHESGAFARNGAVVYAALTLSGETRPIIRYRTADGEVDYYTPDGLSVRKALLRTPVDGLRMSSGFGMRRHPILGYSRMHRGVDFAGPTGTPILAAGDGSVEVIGVNRGYGNYIRLRHSNGLQTAYAHMSRFASGLSRGSRVRQGDVIGYIGSTGLSTGPHLHYEVLVNGSQVNPLSIDMPTGRQLTGGELADFQALAASLEAELSTLIAQQGQLAAVPE